MNYRKHGDKPYKAIVLHGGPGAPGCCAGLCRGLAERFGVLEHLQEGSTALALAEELRDIIEHEALGKTVLIGHSYGAWLAFIFAALYPQYVRKLMLVGSGMFDAKYYPQLVENRNVKIMPKAQKKDVAASGLYPNGVDYNPDHYCLIPDLPDDEVIFNEPQHIALMGEMQALRKSGELLNFADKIRCPVVAIHGKNDPHPVEGIQKPLESRLQAFEMHILDRCGHEPWKEYYAKDAFFALMMRL